MKKIIKAYIKRKYEKSACVFVHYSEENHLNSYVIQYIKELGRFFEEIYVTTNLNRSVFKKGGCERLMLINQKMKMATILVNSLES